MAWVIVAPTDYPPCPRCGAVDSVVRNGICRDGRQLYKCNACGRQYLERRKSRIPDDMRRVAEVLLEEGVKVTIIAKATGISPKTLYSWQGKMEERASVG